MLATIIATIGLKGILAGIVIIWLLVALIKKLFKLAVFAAIILALLYYGLPILSSALGNRSLY